MSVTQTKTQTGTKFIDFQSLKQMVRIEAAVPLLGLQPAQLSDQTRMPCPACKSGGDRALVITVSKSVFYCFASGVGGDVIALTSHVKGIGMKEAAAFLAASFNPAQAPVPASSVATVPSTLPQEQKAGLNPLTYLQPEHPLVQALGISPETAKHFGAGYAPKGIMRGRLAIPIHDLHGLLVAYCGRALKDESPSLIFPNGFQPDELIFNAHQSQKGQLTLVRDPLQVLAAFEGGIDNVVAFLTEAISAQQLDMLSSLMSARHCDAVELF